MLIKNLSFADYCAMPGMNNSKLGIMKRCPAKFKWLCENERSDTDALRIGRAIHTAVLEPHKFNDEFLCLPDIDRRTTKGREMYAELVSQNPDKTILKPDDFNMALDVATSIRGNVHANYLLEGAMTEVTLDWTHPETGIGCKARVDGYNEELGILLDIKTTQDASRSGFPRKLFSYGYHRQAAYYLTGMQANGEKAQHFVFIAVEKEPPYAVGIYRLDDKTIQLSKQENDRLLRLYAECKRADSWPGYTQGIEDISLPDYATNLMEETYGQSL
jgi:exodeoxyribonuclease VIII